MSTNARSNDSISATITIGGSGTNQVLVGDGNTQIFSLSPTRSPSEAELASLRQMLVDLRQLVAVEAPPEKQQAALERVDELESAITSPKPDLTTLEYVKNWFVRHLPNLAGAVVGLVVNPIVGKLVEAAGDAMADQIRNR